MRGAWRAPFWIGLLGAAMAAGCSLLAQPAAEIRRETLARMPLDLPKGRQHSGTLLVSPPETSAAYDTTRMAYQRRSFEIAWFARTEWAARPGQMLDPLLVQTLQRAKVFDAVVTPPFMGRSTHVLRTQILAFGQDFTADPPAFQLDLRVQLVAEPGDRVIATTQIGVREPMQETSPYAGAAAANEATVRALTDLVAFVRASAD